MSVKLPMPTQLDGRSPHFREWPGLHGRISQVGASVEEDTQYHDNKYPIQTTEDEVDELEDYNEIGMSIRKRSRTSTRNQRLPTRTRTTLNVTTHHAHSQWL
eukprot:5702007-Amphidinium_carterae.1